MRRVLPLLVPLLCAACADSVTEPSPPIPSVAGNYAGTTLPGTPLFGPTTTSVTQSGTLVTIEPLQISSGLCPTSIPFSTTTIDQTGSFGTKSGTFSYCRCLYHYTATGGFGERDLQISLRASSPSTATLGEDELPPDGCYNLRLTINLTRQ